MQLLRWVQRWLRDTEIAKPEEKHDHYGVRIDNTYGTIDDGLRYNELGKPIPEWLQKDNDGWISLGHIGDDTGNR
jgi:hypothetical protein